jgi:hypothetical protein
MDLGSSDMAGQVDRLLMTLATFDDVRAAAMVGSNAERTADPFSALEVLVCVSKAVPSGEERLRLYRSGGLGETLAFDQALKARYGKTTGTAFAGIVGGANKVARRIAGAAVNGECLVRGRTA